MNSRISKLALLVGGLTLAASASALTVSSSFTNPLAPTEIDQMGSLNLFDTSLGWLTGAKLTITGGIEGTIQLTYGDASDPTNIRGTTSSDIGINSSLAAIDALFNGTSDISLSYTTGFQMMNPNSVYNSPTLTDSDMNMQTLSGAALAAVQNAGPGTFKISCTSLSGFAVQGGGGFSGGSQETFGQCGAEIVYEYMEHQIPEPGALTLVGLALTGLALGRRRRSAK